MAVKTKSVARPSIKTKARQLLAFAQDQSSSGKNSSELFIVIFGPRGRARTMFPTEKEWAAFERTDEISEIRKLIETSPAAPEQSVNRIHANGDFAVHLPLPKSLHAALLTEAAREGVSLEQLCLSKLVAQLRELV